MKSVNDSQIKDKIDNFIRRKAAEFPELHLLSDKEKIQHSRDNKIK